MSEAKNDAAPIAVLSDIHGNIEALTAVLADADARAASRLLNLGDMVGYGPEPEACVRLLRERGAQSVLGNHELGLVEASARGFFNPQAKKALDRTRALISDDSLMYFRTLPRAFEAEGALFVHGCPPGLVTKYLYELDDGGLREAFRLYANRLCFAGHTHELERISLLPAAEGDDAGKLERKALGKGRLELAPGARHIINAGAVGQPRDGNNKAKYILWEPGKDGAPGAIDVRFVSYDIATTAADIIEKGLPRVYADRLW
ncbi:MAG: hypothetical protein AUJ49_12420 [Desulfovibrionaceae bacterium CG1_02_65_16]|nr:MAG: hypothetical protein AUJ49_12420 [Desulfovibrionaceae bacterium CG1_02_65_16]